MDESKEISPRSAEISQDQGETSRPEISPTTNELIIKPDDLPFVQSMVNKLMHAGWVEPKWVSLTEETTNGDTNPDSAGAKLILLGTSQRLSMSLSGIKDMLYHVARLRKQSMGSETGLDNPNSALSLFKRALDSEAQRVENIPGPRPLRSLNEYTTKELTAYKRRLNKV